MENKYRNLLDYLEATAARLPDRVAVEDPTEQMTWQGLVRAARQIGSGLAARIQPGEPTALFMEKSPRTLAAMLGVLYAGGFYVLLDPSQPAKRIQTILEVLQPKLVLTEGKTAAALADVPGEYQGGDLEEMLQTAENPELLTERRTADAREQILYGIFTSGSTGVPKGVVVSQGAVIDFISNFAEIFAFSEEDRIGNQAPFDFDVSVKDIYTAILTGARLVLIPREYFATPPRLLDYLCDRRVTSLTWAVSALTLVSALKGLKYKVPVDVKRVMFSGEVMPIRQLTLWQEALPEAKFVNLYGPTEITCNCTYYPIDRKFEKTEKLPLGQAFPGREVFLVNEQGERVTAPGESGEICIAGESLAAGYYHNPEETGKHFVEREDCGRCYLSGDLGYYDETGSLYFAGRKDFQIKHMGHRIELEEIEQGMLRVTGVERACCYMDEKKNRLCAGYVGAIEPEELRARMKELLPAFMIPHTMKCLEELPLTKNGKTDRRLVRELMGGKQ